MTYRKKRTTKETNIDIELSFENTETNINTGVGFLDHMLTLFSFHSGISLNIEVDGDTYVDDHHTVEDIGIVIGQLLLEAIKDKQSFARYGSFYIPMDETLARAVTDISGRPYLSMLNSQEKKLVHLILNLLKNFLEDLSLMLVLRPTLIY